MKLVFSFARMLETYRRKRKAQYVYRRASIVNRENSSSGKLIVQTTDRDFIEAWNNTLPHRAYVKNKYS